MNKIAFLFGAGAESNFGLLNGTEFWNKSGAIPSGFGKTERGKALKEIFKEINDFEEYQYTSYTLSSIHVKINDDEGKSKNGLLDRFFHTIINPHKHGEIYFSIVVNYYWCCYFAIVDCILKYLKNNSLLNTNLNEYYTEEKTDYKKILSQIDIFTKELYNIDLSKISTQNYYSEISKKIKEKSFDCCGIITTNYFKFVEIIKQALPDIEIAYPNGQLKLFEYPSLLEIQDFSINKKTSYDKNRIFFPFIFGQSFIKPIVNSNQINEFKKIENILTKADVLAIVGYGINEDDNHINAFLHDFIKKGKQIIYVSSNEGSDKLKVLKLTDDYKDAFTTLNYDFSKTSCSEIVNDLFNQIAPCSNKHKVIK